MEDLYSVLGVSPSATRADIEAAYGGLRSEHPHSLPAAVHRAYATLSNAERRRVYDYSRVDPRGLRALLGVDERKEKVVWNIQGRAGEEPIVAPPPDPWGLTHAERPKEQPKRDPARQSKKKKPRRTKSVANASENRPDHELSTQSSESDHMSWESLGSPAEPALSAGDDDSIAGQDRVEQPDLRDIELRNEGSTGTSVEEQVVTAAKTTKEKKQRRQRKPKATPAPEPPVTPNDEFERDLEAVTLTSYRAPLVVPKPFRLNALDFLAEVSVAAVVLAALVGMFAYWQYGRDDDGDAAANVQAGPTLAPEILASLAPLPDFIGSAELPTEMQAVASQTIAAYQSADGGHYEMLGLVAVQTSSGDYFYAAVGRETGSLNGTGQRVFFFKGAELLGVDWQRNSRSVVSLTATAGGSLMVAYAVYDDGDETCCPAQPPLVVTYRFDDGLISDTATPPEVIFVPVVGG